MVEQRSNRNVRSCYILYCKAIAARFVRITKARTVLKSVYIDTTVLYGGAVDDWRDGQESDKRIDEHHVEDVRFLDEKEMRYPSFARALYTHSPGTNQKILIKA